MYSHFLFLFQRMFTLSDSKGKTKHFFDIDFSKNRFPVVTSTEEFSVNGPLYFKSTLDNKLSRYSEVIQTQNSEIIFSIWDSKMNEMTMCDSKRNFSTMIVILHFFWHMVFFFSFFLFLSFLFYSFLYEKSW